MFSLIFGDAERNDLKTQEEMLNKGKGTEGMREEEKGKQNGG